MKKLIIIFFLCLVTVTSCRKVTEWYEIDFYTVYVNETDHTISLIEDSASSPTFTLTGPSSYSSMVKSDDISAHHPAPMKAEVIIDGEISVYFEYKYDDRDPYNPCLDRNFDYVYPTNDILICTFTFTEEAVEYYINLAKEQQGE